VYLERFTSDLYLDKPSDMQHYNTMYDHLQAQALNLTASHDFITDTATTHAADIRS
jgi:hypothetical protein